MAHKHVVQAAILLGFAAAASAQSTHVVDTSAPGKAFSPGVRGQALADLTIDRPGYTVALPKSLEVSDGAALRGVAGGLAAELYDWRSRNNEPRPPTLEFLRYSRDHDAELFLTVNMRGLVRPENDPSTAGYQEYYDTSIPTLAALAGDWVRYTNHIVPTYRQGDVVSVTRDAAILNSLKWSSTAKGDSFDKLAKPGEAAPAKVKYWEIGNEPRVSVVVPYGVVNGYTFIAPPSPETAVRKNDYRERYAALTTAMRAEDPTIKVGPALVSGQSTTERPLLDSLLNAQPDGSRLPIDFISYHPYERMGDLNTAAEIETHLGGIYTKQAGFRTYLRGAITASGRDPNAIELVASEYNVSYHTTGDTVKEAQMAHALGTAETIFSHARLGLKASHYWIHAVDQYDGTEYPVFKAMEGLRDHMGDTLLATSASGNARTYTTRDSATGELAVWVLNFDNDDDITIDLALQGLSGDEDVTLMRLGALSGDTTLFSSNLASHQTGGPTLDVDWRSFDLSGIDLSAYALSAPAATLSVLLIQPVPEPAAVTGLLVVAAGLLRRSRAARRSNGDITEKQRVRSNGIGKRDITDYLYQ